ncbi:uncharacterized protein [Nicotiana sylvestris]|uniref:uncharacterized protein n=1 Tax=Nicotiana sylvestris TaxID=4096 RepID=UPI00388C4967
MGGMVEEGLKSNKIMSYSALKVTTQAIQNGTGGVLGKKKKENVATIESGAWFGSRSPSPYYNQLRPHHQTYPHIPYSPPQQYYPPPDPHFSVNHAQTYTQPPTHAQWRAPAPQNPYPASQNAYPPPRAYRSPLGTSFRPNHASKNDMLQKKKTFTPLGESYTSLYHRLRQLGMLNPIEPTLSNPPSRNLDHSVSCEYCSGATGHDTEKCWHLKTAIQELIDTHRIEVQALEAPNINQNPLSVNHETHMIELIHKGGEAKKPSQTVMMICSSEVKPSEKSTGGKSVIQLKETDNKPVLVVEKGSSSIGAVKLEKAKVVLPRVASKPVVVVKGARIEPVIIKPVNQLPVINSKVVPWSYEQVTVTYKGKEVREEVCEAHGLTRSGRCFTSE